ncbi:UDP-N-acetylmuramyl-tripeptide synthetase [Candidatus Peregrinibacteria bacterium]|nr:MAG: UDP-N-acetylmuramyl-tripeptide synthetase [Candidatus Peregrinibacteria bacterium]
MNAFNRPLNTLKNYIHRWKASIAPDHPIRLMWHQLKARIAAQRYRFPADHMVVIGVTGTNGKTTTTHLIEHLLRRAGKRVAMLSTIEFRIDGHIQPNTSKMTTLSPFKTQAFLAECLKNDIEYVVIEASSHALHQHRLWGVEFNIGVLTNITHEHLDYHMTMEAYKNAKKILFKNVERTCQMEPTERVADIPHYPAMILNTADTYFPEFKQMDCPNKITYGLHSGMVMALDMSSHTDYSTFFLKTPGDEIEVYLPMAGSFNVENALAASSVALACEVDLEDIQAGLACFPGVPGRMERIVSPKGFEVMVDFALTPDALSKLYRTLDQTKKGRLIGIIGGTGERDRDKRPMLGKIVAEHTDLTIVTDEEPYSENPRTIMEAVLDGAKKTNKTLDRDLFLIEDRYRAIEFAVEHAEPNDTIVVTGMGNFQTRSTNAGPIAWDEREVVREIIERHS